MLIHLLRFKTNQVESKETRSYVEKYLDLGEWVLDISAAFMKNSGYFEQR